MYSWKKKESRKYVSNFNWNSPFYVNLGYHRFLGWCIAHILLIRWTNCHPLRFPMKHPLRDYSASISVVYQLHVFNCRFLSKLKNKFAIDYLGTFHYFWYQSQSQWRSPFAKPVQICLGIIAMKWSWKLQRNPNYVNFVSTAQRL